MRPVLRLTGWRVLGAVPTLALLAIFFGGWEVYVDSGGVDSLILPAPHAIVSTLYTDRGLVHGKLGRSAEPPGVNSERPSSRNPPVTSADSTTILPCRRGALQSE